MEDRGLLGAFAQSSFWWFERVSYQEKSIVKELVEYLQLINFSAAWAEDDLLEYGELLACVNISKDVRGKLRCLKEFINAAGPIHWCITS